MLQIIVVGARGITGRRHVSIHQKQGAVVHSVDLSLGDPAKALAMLLKDNPKETVVDICTPTGSHTAVMRQAYRLGARKFIVEKPASLTALDWQQTLDELANADIFMMQNYLFSQAIKHLRAVTVERGLHPLSLTSNFDKDRRTESESGRGADKDGEPPHVFRIEMPHQLYVANALLGSLEPIAATATPMIIGSRKLANHGSGIIELRGPTGTAKLTSNLAAQPARWFRVECSDGSILTATFASPSLHSKVILQQPNGAKEQLYSGKDSGLQRALAAAKDSFDGTPVTIPDDASPGSALVVLQQIDAAIALASFKNEGSV